MGARSGTATEESTGGTRARTYRPAPYTGDWRRKTITERKYVAKFGGEVRASRNGALGIVLRSLLISPEYTIRDRVNYFRGVLGSMRLLWPQLLEVDLFEQVPELKVPVFLTEGLHDWEVPSTLSERYFEVLRAPSKRLVWFENSAHLPNSEERGLFHRVMRYEVHPIAVSGVNS